MHNFHKQLRGVDKKTVTVYTDGSCNATYKVGGWASLIFLDEEKIILKGIVENTTHQRMELQAIIETIEFISLQNINASILIYTDSQYAINIPHRKGKIQAQNFITKNNNTIRNDDLLRTLIGLFDKMEIVFIKVKAHQQQSVVVNHNREVDKLARQMVRQRVSVLKNVLNGTVL